MLCQASLNPDFVNNFFTPRRHTPPDAKWFIQRIKILGRKMYTPDEVDVWLLAHFVNMCNKWLWGWRCGSRIERTFSCQGPECICYHPHDVLQQSITTVPGYPPHSSGLHRFQADSQCTYTHIFRQNSHTHKTKLNKPNNQYIFKCPVFILMIKLNSN